MHAKRLRMRARHKSQRAAKSRVALLRAPEPHCLISLNCWADRAETLEPVWDQVLDSLVFGACVAGPTVGPVVH